MFDINKIRKIAQEVGVDINPQEVNGRKGLFFRNKNGQLEKWDAITEFGLNEITPQRSYHYNNFFNKDFYEIKENEFNKSPYNSNKQSDYSTHKKYNGQALITEAA